MTRFIWVAILCICATTITFSTPQEWSKLYSYAEWKSLQHLRDTGKLTPEWSLLLNALLAVDSNQAVPLYHKTISSDNEGTAKSIAKLRLQQLVEFTASISQVKPVESSDEPPDTTEEPNSHVVRAIPDSPPSSLHLPKTAVTEMPFQCTTQVALAAVETKSGNEPEPAVATIKQDTSVAVNRRSRPAKTKNNPDAKYVAQFGVFAVKSTADRIAGQIQDAGYSVEILEWQTETKKLYRVICGRFLTQKEAAAQVAAVKQKVPLEGIATRIE